MMTRRRRSDAANQVIKVTFLVVGLLSQILYLCTPTKLNMGWSRVLDIYHLHKMVMVRETYRYRFLNVWVAWGDLFPWCCQVGIAGSNRSKRKDCGRDTTV